MDKGHNLNIPKIRKIKDSSLNLNNKSIKCDKSYLLCLLHFFLSIITIIQAFLNPEEQQSKQTFLICISIQQIMFAFGIVILIKVIKSKNVTAIIYQLDVIIDEILLYELYVLTDQFWFGALSILYFIILLKQNIKYKKYYILIMALYNIVRQQFSNQSFNITTFFLSVIIMSYLYLIEQYSNIWEGQYLQISTSECLEIEDKVFQIDKSEVINPGVIDQQTDIKKEYELQTNDVQNCSNLEQQNINIKNFYLDILNILPFGIVILDSNNQILYNNQEILQIFNCQEQDIPVILLNLSTQRFLNNIQNKIHSSSLNTIKKKNQKEEKFSIKLNKLDNILEEEKSIKSDENQKEGYKKGQNQLQNQSSINSNQNISLNTFKNNNNNNIIINDHKNYFKNKQNLNVSSLVSIKKQQNNSDKDLIQKNIKIKNILKTYFNSKAADPLNNHFECFEKIQLNKLKKGDNNQIANNNIFINSQQSNSIIRSINQLQEADNVQTPLSDKSNLSLIEQIKQDQGLGFFQYFGSVAFMQTSYQKKNLIIKFSQCEFKQLTQNEPAIIITVEDSWDEANKKTLENFSKRKMKMFASICHELRTPLNCSINLLDIVRHQINSESICTQFIEPALSSNRILLNYVNDILDFVQMDDEKFKFSFQNFNLKKFIQDNLDILLFQAKLKKIELDLDYDNTLPILFNSDQNRIRQILLNLLSNALKFTIKGKITVLVKNQQKSTQNEQQVITITVQDTGIGISKDNQKQIFQLFNKIDNLENNALNTQGCGFGLTLSNSLAKKLGPVDSSGITVKSEVNVGSSFSFALIDQSNSNQQQSIQNDNNQIINDFQALNKKQIPIIDSSNIESISERNKLPQQQINLQISNLQPHFINKNIVCDNNSEYNQKCKCLQVLIVDDNMFNIYALSKILETWNIKYESVICGNQALQLIQERYQQNKCCPSYKLMIIDIEMIEMDGYETCLKIKELYQKYQQEQPTIIACSSYDIKNVDIQKLQQNGATTCLQKPIDKNQLEVYIYNIIK